MLGISRATLYRKLKRYNIGPTAKADAMASSSQ
jgi:DNA-binding NtrC family response regulator